MAEEWHVPLDRRAFGTHSLRGLTAVWPQWAQGLFRITTILSYAAASLACCSTT